MGFISSRIWRNDDEEKMSDLLKPPQPKKIPKVHTAHGDERIDDYYWLRDDTRKDLEVISYLEAENRIKTNSKYLKKLGFFGLFLFLANGFDGLRRIVRSF